MKKLIWLLVLLLCSIARGADAREIIVELTVPDAAWKITIDEVHRVGNELWVISTVSRDPDIMGAQVISKVKDSLVFEASDLPAKHFVIGKSWEWQNKESYRFIDDMGEIERELKSGERLYKRNSR